MMKTWKPSIINWKKDAENLLASAWDYRIFLWNLSFRLYLRYIKNILKTKSSTFMEKCFLGDQRKMWYGKTWVRSYELRVERSKATTEIQKCEFKSTSYEFKSTSLNSRVLCSTLRVTTSNLWVTNSKPRV